MASDPRNDPRNADGVRSDATGPSDARPRPSPGAAEAGDECAAEAIDPGVLAQELEAARAKADENQDLYLRTRAELENVRRRGQEEVAKAHKFAIESFAESLLAVCDSLEMALKVQSPSVDSYREGVEATLKQLGTVFERNKLHAIDPLGQKFDPNQHQAISTVPAAATNPPVAPGSVATVLQKGYLINDRVLRPALVAVAQ